MNQQNYAWRVAGLIALALAGSLLAQSPATNTLSGLITDPSGAAVPGALIQVRSPGKEQRARTNDQGEYSINLSAGVYQVRVIAKGFTLVQRQNFAIKGSPRLDVQLKIEMESQVVNVEDEANRVGVDPTQNGGALVLGQRELAALSDDPDELAQQLQAMAGPGAGPSGGQIYVDGFTGGSMPPKSSIREVRVNSNPYSTEYDRPGFGRIEILTKPGTDSIRGQAFFQFNNQDLNTRSPLLAGGLPDYSQRFYGLNLSGPIVKNKASFGVDFERRDIRENALVLATALDSNLQPQTVNQAVVTPQNRTNLTSRVDYAINGKNTLVLRYQHTRIELDKQGVGDFALPEQAHNEKNGEDTVQFTYTNIASARLINETRFQFMRATTANDGDNTTPALIVQGAFSGGGAQIGTSGNTTNRWELTNLSTFNRNAHTFKWGVRVKQVFDDDRSVNNFGGTYTFFGGLGPQLDANNQPIAGTAIELTGLERYRRTLLFQNLSAAQIRALGGGASQFSLSAGTPVASVQQFDIGLFFQDDFRAKPNLTLSYGMRYEAQTNSGSRANWAPRVGIAWGIDGRGNKPAKTVIRIGAGVFYDRISESYTLSAERFNGQTQQSYFLINPDTYPAIPSVGALSKQPQQLQILYAGVDAPRTFQWSVGGDRQINKYLRLSVNYIGSRGEHILRSRNINTPINGSYPYGDTQLRQLTESTGMSRSNMLLVSPTFNYKKIFLFGFYALGYGKSDAEGQPQDPYNLRAEWGPSSFSDVRHRFVMGTSIPLPWKISISPFMMLSSGSPYNISTGRDPLSTGSPTQRPALVGLTASQCTGVNYVYSGEFGCFNLNPAAGTAIERNYGRGPANVNMNLRISRTWAFGNKGESGPADQNGPPPGMGGARGGGPGPGGGGPPGGGPPSGGGPPGGMFGAQSGKKYNLTLSASVRNFINHPSYAAPSGDLSSPYFGQYRSLAGFGPFGSSNTTYNRKVDLQLRLQF